MNKSLKLNFWPSSTTVYRLMFTVIGSVSKTQIGLEA